MVCLFSCLLVEMMTELSGLQLSAESVSSSRKVGSSSLPGVMIQPPSHLAALLPCCLDSLAQLARVSASQAFCPNSQSTSREESIPGPRQAKHGMIVGLARTLDYRAVWALFSIALHKSKHICKELMFSTRGASLSRCSRRFLAGNPGRGMARFDRLGVASYTYIHTYTRTHMRHDE